jgi:hypothetical protein
MGKLSDVLQGAAELILSVTCLVGVSLLTTLRLLPGAVGLAPQQKHLYHFAERKFVLLMAGKPSTEPPISNLDGGGSSVPIRRRRGANLTLLA